ncbi:hypothetical protein EJ02DRAFT_427695 [Clathrospora elynae]|uniref:Uncharacterized protein n=1 Tax=Clathrospora elynae TaxID=706981 RepID=A0A6A5S851_9PLEO|nr:hypothetical protein EJ02DRAFT_427695 [Clathrospora elynae]
MYATTIPLDTPIACHAAPVVKLLAAICLCCSKRIREGGEACSKARLKKCAYCTKLKKSYDSVPPDFHRDVNALLCSHSKVAAAVGVGKQLLLKGFTQARRSYVANVEAFVRQAVKHGGRKCPYGDEIHLLQVDATNSIVTALEGILDVMRQQTGLTPLGNLNAPTGVNDNMPDLGSGDDVRDLSPSDSVSTPAPTLTPRSKVKGKEKRRAERAFSGKEMEVT